MHGKSVRQIICRPYTQTLAVAVVIRESNCLKYCSGSGSRNLIFSGSVPVQVQDFSKIWGSVQVQSHQNLRFRFGSGSMISKFKRFGFTQKSGFYLFVVRFDSLLVSDSLNFEKQKECYAL